MIQYGNIMVTFKRNRLTIKGVKDCVIIIIIKFLISLHLISLTFTRFTHSFSYLNSTSFFLLLLHQNISRLSSNDFFKK